MPAIETLRERVHADVVLRRLPTLTDAPLYLVGGAVRDALRGATWIADWDIAVPGDAVALTQELADAVGGSFVGLHEAHATARVVLGGAHYDLAAYRASTLEDDLRARDLTVNAIAVDLRALLAGDDTVFIDPCGGVGDLEQQRLRPCGPEVFTADPLRAIRLARFVATLGFLPTQDAEAQARMVLAREGGSWWWNAIAPERVTDELAALFTGPHAAEGITFLTGCGAFDALVPHFAETRGLAQGRNHHLDVYGHDLAASVVVASDFLPSLGEWAAPFAASLQQWLDLTVGGERTRRWLVPFAALLHDVGKVVTHTTKPNGQPDFARHEAAGGYIAADVATRLRLSRAERKWLVAFVRYHGYPNALQRHGPDHPLRFFAVTGEAAPGIILVAMGDRATARGPARPPEKVAADIAFLQGLVRDYFGKWTPLLATPPLVRGGEVMEALGIPPGKRVGELLLLLRRRQLTGEVTTPAEAIDAARKINALRHGMKDRTDA